MSLMMEPIGGGDAADVETVTMTLMVALMNIMIVTWL